MYEETVVIYSDLLFLINFCLDFLCLFITGRLLHCGARTTRLLFAAAIGGMYSFVPYLWEIKVFISLPLSIISALLICFTAFGKRDGKSLLLLTTTYFVTSALMGGLITAVYSISNQYSDGVYTEVEPMSFFIICVFSALAALSYGLICRKKIHVRSAEIRFYTNGKKFEARLLADSGNLVTEPFSALPVIVVVSSALPYPYDSPESEVFPLPIRAIPFRTGAGKSCFFGFRPERIELLRPARKPKRIEAYIGIDTENKSYSGYDGLLPASLI